MAGKYAQGGIVNAASRYELEGGEAVMPIAWFVIVRLFAAFWLKTLQ